MILKPHQSALVKAWNLFSKLGPRSIMTPRLNAKEIMTDAVKKSGHSDFGGLEFIEGLDRLIHSLNATANLHPFGRFYIKQVIMTQLINRLRVEACIKENPEILEQHIRSPLIIFGVPRTGSSFLFNLLAQDPSHRYLRNWETVVSQVPPPGTYDIKTDPRRRMGNRLLKLQNYLAPELSNIHTFTLDGPEECTPLMMQSFALSVYGTMFNVPEYMDWLQTASRVAMYKHHKRILQTLQWKYPGKRWLLKSPLHMEGLKDLLSVYPDACLIHTHRDPAKSVPSYASLSAAFRGITTRSIDTEELGQQTIELLSFPLKNFLSLRKRIGSERIMDISYTDLTRDPMRSVQQIYQHFELEHTNTSQTRIKNFLTQDRTVKRKHTYEARQFGLTASQIRERFHAYESMPVLEEKSVGRTNAVASSKSVAQVASFL